MSSRRALLESLLLARLPSAFQEVEYIESSGTQYIDTGVLTSNNIKVACVAINTFGMSGEGGNYGSTLLGGRLSISNSNFSVISGTNNDYVGNGTAFLTITKNQNTENIYLEYDNSSISYVCGNYSYIDNSLNINITNPNNIYLFALNQNGSSTNNGTYKLYSCKIYNNNALVRNFVPCYRKADNEIGLYDLVNGVFYTNAGTGAFTKGPNV